MKILESGRLPERILMYIGRNTSACPHTIYEHFTQSVRKSLVREALQRMFRANLIREDGEQIILTPEGRAYFNSQQIEKPADITPAPYRPSVFGPQLQSKYLPKPSIREGSEISKSWPSRQL